MKRLIFSVMRSIFAITMMAWLTLNTSSQVVYPGYGPGTARFKVDGGQIIVTNSLISGIWKIESSSLQLHTIMDTVMGSKLELTGDLFEIVLDSGKRYSSGQMQVKSKAIITELSKSSNAAQLASRLPGKQVTVQLISQDGELEIVWRLIMRDRCNYIRQEITVTSIRGDCNIKEIVWCNQGIAGTRAAGSVDGSPLVKGDFFMGIEDPMAVNVPVKAGEQSQSDTKGIEPGYQCKLPRNALLRRGESLSQSFVIGVAPTGQMRRAFLYYLEQERAHPYRPYLHYNSWYDTAWNPFALNETNCLDAIEICGERFIKPYQVVMDGMVFDDGWDNPKSLWQFHSGFPNGFTPLAKLCKEYNTRLGVWLSPFGGYGEPKNQRIQFGSAQGFETNATGFSLAGSKYYAAFKQACVQMIRQYGVNHFKFDGIATGMYANGSGQYILDTEAMRRLMLELRQEDPNLYINLTTGSWPSPFWLRFADSLWRQGGDMGHAGKGTKQQQWLTYRDQQIYQNIVRKGPLYPLNALMTQGVAYSRHGMAGDPTFNSKGFKDDVRAFFGSGTSLQELYIQPGKLTSNDWQVLAEAAKWSRSNADVLVDTHWIGGEFSLSAVYGFASWNRRKGIIMLRNPDDQPHEFSLEIGMAFELPKEACKRYKLKSPWAEDSHNEPMLAEQGKPLKLSLKPFEVLIFNADPLD